MLESGFAFRARRIQSVYEQRFFLSSPLQSPTRNPLTSHHSLFTRNWVAFDVSQGFEAADTLLDGRMAGENAVRLGLELLNGIDKEHMRRAPIARLENGRIV